MRKLFLGLGALLTTVACASAPVPAVLFADPADLRTLIGEWHGEYSSSGPGRSGSILFVLDATATSAFGEVLMVPMGYTPPRTPEQASQQIRRPIPQIVAVSFVRVENGTLSGQLEPYRDPDCGCPLSTVFRGRQTEQDRMEGTFSTLGPPGHAPQSGQWAVARISPKR